MCSSRVTYIEISVQRSILLLQIYLRTLAIVLIMICSSVVLRNVMDFCYQYDNELNIYKNQQELHCFCFHYGKKKKKKTIIIFILFAVIMKIWDLQLVWEELWACLESLDILSLFEV